MNGVLNWLAEEEGFEPSLPGLRAKRFSRPPHSTTLPPLRGVQLRMVSEKKAPRKGAFHKIHYLGITCKYRRSYCAGICEFVDDSPEVALEEFVLAEELLEVYLVKST